MMSRAVLACLASILFISLSLVSNVLGGKRFEKVFVPGPEEGLETVGHDTVPDIALATKLRSCIRKTRVFDDDPVVDLMVEELRAPRGLATQPPSQLVYVHVPKNGGNSVLKFFKEAWARMNCSLMEVSGSGGKHVTFKNGSAPCTWLRYASGLGPDLYPWGIFTNRPKQLPPLHSSLFVVSHASFGICRYLTGEGGCTYTTVLREPVSRFVSHVRWECHFNKDTFGKACDSVSAFVQKSLKKRTIHFYGLDSHQTRMLSGDDSKDDRGEYCITANTCKPAPPWSIQEHHLRGAIHNLVFHTPVWGHLEEIDSFASRIHRVYGFGGTLPKEISNPARGNMSTKLSDDDIRLIKQALWPDMRLYEFSTCVLQAGSPRFQA